MGLAYQYKNDFPNALASFQKCLELDKKNWSAHMNMATLCKQMNLLDQAEKHKATCIKLNPEAKLMFEEIEKYVGSGDEADHDHEHGHNCGHHHHHHHHHHE